MPYIPTGNAQAVLVDGRVIIEGGEFTGVNLDFTLTNRGAIYDSVANSWTSVQPPPFFVDLYPPRAQFAPNPIGDASCVVLADGTFMGDFDFLFRCAEHDCADWRSLENLQT